MQTIKTSPDIGMLPLILLSIILNSLPVVLSDYPPASAHGHNFYQAPGAGKLNGGAGGAGGYVYDDFYPSGGPNGSQYPSYYPGANRCVPIPSTLTLCRDIGYSEMRLPNLLQHDNLAEVQQQSSSWTHLLRIQCHHDTQIFLCSLFAPVCLNQPIWPCRSLCEAVKSGCEDKMLKYGYPWPDMLRCDQFPTDDQLCMQLRGNRTDELDHTCNECSSLLTYQDIIDSMCQAAFVMRVNIDEMLVSGPDVKLVVTGKRRILKPGTVSRKLLRSAEIFIEGGAHCDCPPTEGRGKQGGGGGTKNQHYLIMGVKDGMGRLVVSRLSRVDRASVEMKKALKQLKKQQTAAPNKAGRNTESSGGSRPGQDMCSKPGQADPNAYGPAVIVDSVESRHSVISSGGDLNPDWLGQGSVGNSEGEKKKKNGNKKNKNNKNKNKKNKEREQRRKRKLDERELVNRNKRVRRNAGLRLSHLLHKRANNAKINTLGS